ncbi:Secreted and transmembrane protein 1b [Lemmus lemmus]
MVAYPVISTGSCPRILCILLLLTASLNAHNHQWDKPVCTKPAEVSAPRGSRVLMGCNISHTFKDITIELTANGKTMTIFDQKPPGNYFNDSWHLQIQGGQAQLVITDAQDIHAGQYLWRLNGLQRKDENLTLNVTESLQVNAGPPSSDNEVRVIVVIIIIVILIIISIMVVFACRKRYRLPKYHRYEVPGPDLSHEFPGSPHWTRPKVFHVLHQKVLKGPY